MITIKNLNKEYITGGKSLWVLKNISLEIKQNEMVALTGKSGSGKSTLLNILGMLDTYDSGEYYLNNILIKDLPEETLTEYRNLYIGFIFQRFHLIPFKTALENVALPLYYRRIPKAEREQSALEMLDRVGLADKADNFPNELSGGQQQRVSIARALVTDPKLILADEPTGALDSKTSSNILQLLTDINKEGKTVIIVTHDPNVASNCNRHIKLIDGKIVD